MYNRRQVLYNRLCKRPFKTVEKMDEARLAKWNAKVADEDDVWILGLVGGQPVTMCHYPMLSWPEDKKSHMIYGHIHNHVTADYWPLIMKRERMLNAGVEVNGYEPVTFDELVANNRKFHRGTCA